MEGGYEFGVEESRRKQEEKGYCVISNVEENPGGVQYL